MRLSPGAHNVRQTQSVLTVTRFGRKSLFSRRSTNPSRIEQNVSGARNLKKLFRPPAISFMMLLPSPRHESGYVLSQPLRIRDTFNQPANPQQTEPHRSGTSAAVAKRSWAPTGDAAALAEGKKNALVIEKKRWRSNSTAHLHDPRAARCCRTSQALMAFVSEPRIPRIARKLSWRAAAVRGREYS